jgi:hypothetical protein
VGGAAGAAGPGGPPGAGWAWGGGRAAAAAAAAAERKSHKAAISEESEEEGFGDEAADWQVYREMDLRASDSGGWGFVGGVGGGAVFRGGEMWLGSGHVLW